jgi:1-acyl-sn-glycerol-3-phosphate acyltransferase
MARHVIGRAWLKVFRWRLETVTPEDEKFVVIAAPHTSGWDLPFMLATAWSMDVPISWMGKRELFAPPFGWFMRMLGGIPIDRSKHHNTVAWAVDRLKQSDRLVLSIPAKGTRKKTDYWKSGFYHIARGANVPVALAYLDFGQKRCGIRAFIVPTGDVKADMDRVRHHYADVVGKFAELTDVPRLREEDENAAKIPSHPAPIGEAMPSVMPAAQPS